MKRTTSPLLAIAAAIVGTSVQPAMTTIAQSQAGVSAAPLDVTKLGPQVGEHVPDFSLSDQRGQPQTLSSLMGPKGLVLVFNRSADW